MQLIAEKWRNPSENLTWNSVRLYFVAKPVWSNSVKIHFVVWALVAAQTSEKHGDKWVLIWYFWWDIFTSIPIWNHSWHSVGAAEAPRSNISSHGTCLIWSWKAAPGQRKAVWWKGEHLFEVPGKSMET